MNTSTKLLRIGTHPTYIADFKQYFHLKNKIIVYITTKDMYNKKNSR